MLDQERELSLAKRQLEETRKALKEIYDHFMETIREGGIGAVNYAVAGRMKDLAAWGLRRIEEVKGEGGR